MINRLCLNRTSKNDNEEESFLGKSSILEYKMSTVWEACSLVKIRKIYIVKTVSNLTIPCHMLIIKLRRFRKFDNHANLIILKKRILPKHVRI